MSSSNQSLEVLDLSSNQLTGKLPHSLGKFANLKNLDLSRNSVNSRAGVSGPIPKSIGNLSNLGSLNLDKNMMNGTIPESIELLLRGNTLTGSISEKLCRPPFLHLLDLAENNISGSIPPCLGDMQGFKLPQTYFIYLSYSYSVSGYVQYTRHIKLALNGRTTEYTNQVLVHSVIDFSKNHLSGEIPEKITQLIHLGALNLSWNQLTGNIPNNIGSLTDLEILDLSHNHFSGLIPPSMASMTFLSHLNLSYNNLFGQIPVANQFGTFNEPSIYVGNPGLCGHLLPTNCTSLLPGNGEQDRKQEDGV